MWTKDGGELPDLDRVIVEGRELTFISLNKTDNGTYRCEASNLLGTSSAEYVLFVYGEFRERPMSGASRFPATNLESFTTADKDPQRVTARREQEGNSKVDSQQRHQNSGL